MTRENHTFTKDINIIVPTSRTIDNDNTARHSIQALARTQIPIQNMYHPDCLQRHPVITAKGFDPVSSIQSCFISVSTVGKGFTTYSN